MSLLCQSLGSQARTIEEREIPPSLAPWVPWVLYEARDRDCPFIHNQHDARRCAWPSRLVLRLDNAAGDFERWPQEVKVNGQPASVTEREGKPIMWLPPGRHEIAGRWRWEHLPESLFVPPDTALVSLFVDETAVSWPDIRPDGQLWLKQQAGKTALEARLEIQVFRRTGRAHEVLLAAYEAVCEKTTRAAALRQQQSGPIRLKRNLQKNDCWLDLSPMANAYRGSGSASYHRALLLGLLIYG